MKILKTLAIALMISSMACTTAFATAEEDETVGDGNIESGGGDMGSGTDDNFWIPGHDGVRVTVIRTSDRAVITVPIDFTNTTQSAGIYHFGKVSKISYTNGNSLYAQYGTYTYSTPSISIPTIVSSSGVNNITAIRNYFTSEYFVQLLSDQTGMAYDTLLNGDYKLLLEPIAYFTFGGYKFCATATEAALYDSRSDVNLSGYLLSLNRKNLPLSMYLEVADLGYSAWTGSTTSNVSNTNIIASLGLGIVSFEPDAPPPEVTTSDYIYRTNTQVITTVTVTGGESNPDDSTTVKFNINGTNYSVSNVYYPSGDSQDVWVKWTTPDTPQTMIIPVTVDGPGGATNASITVQIVDFEENVPPNPVADDRNDRFTQEVVPTNSSATSNTWSMWSCWWQPFWEWESNWVRVSGSHSSSCADDCTSSHSYLEDRGEWVDNGWWEYDYNVYSASLSATMTITPDSYSPTASTTTMKSGYGINQTVVSRLTTNLVTAVTGTPNASTYFPEFEYETYWRNLERTSSGTTSTLQFKTNHYSTYNNRTHFTPIWFPNGEYKAYTYLIDYWTPAGMLSINLTDNVTINGTVWDDWHIGPK